MRWGCGIVGGVTGGGLVGVLGHGNEGGMGWVGVRPPLGGEAISVVNLSRLLCEMGSQFCCTELVLPTRRTN